MLCFPFSTTQSHLFPWFSISGTLSGGGDSWGEEGSMENNWAFMSEILLPPCLEPSWLQALVGGTSAWTQPTGVG